MAITQTSKKHSKVTRTAQRLSKFGPQVKFLHFALQLEGQQVVIFILGH